MEEAERCNKIGFIWKGNLVACDTPEGVKQGLMREQILSLKCPDLNSAYKYLRTHSLVKDVNLYGDEIHLVVENAAAAIPELKKSLAAAHHTVETLEQIQPSIEDVFVSLSKTTSNG
jgi:ABC-2 type transport system ATP-binding protein